MMLYFQSVGEAEAVFKALSTPMRLKIMEMIYKNDSLSMNDLAEALGLTNGAISMHISKLEEADLVKIKTTSGKRGTMKIVRPKYFSSVNFNSLNVPILGNPITDVYI